MTRETLLKRGVEAAIVAVVVGEALDELRQRNRRSKVSSRVRCTTRGGPGATANRRPRARMTASASSGPPSGT